MVSYGDEVGPEIVAPPEDFDLVLVGNNGVNSIIDFFWLHRLASYRCSDQVLRFVVGTYRGHGAFGEDVACLCRVSTCDPAPVNRVALVGQLLPGDLGFVLVAAVFEPLLDRLFLLVQYPTEDVAVVLERLEGYAHDVIVAQYRILELQANGPGRIHVYNSEEAAMPRELIECE